MITPRHGLLHRLGGPRTERALLFVAFFATLAAFPVNTSFDSKLTMITTAPMATTRARSIHCVPEARARWERLCQIRREKFDYMLANPVSWKQATRSPKFRKSFTLGGDALSRPPRGYDPGHELIDDLKRKDFIASAQLDDAELLRPDLVKRLAARYQQVAPMLDWLCGALDLEF